MASQINLEPPVLNLKLYSGDGFSVKFTCTNNAGAPIDLTGTVEAEVREDRMNPEDDPIVNFEVDLVDAYLGIAVLKLSGEQTQLLTDDYATNGKFEGVWDVQWTPAGSEPRTLVQGVVECVRDVTR